MADQIRRFYSSIPLPLPRRFTFDGTLGSEFDRYPEGDIAGTAGPMVARLAMKIADGSEIEAELQRAPKRLVAHHPRLGRFRFFDLFASDEVVAIEVWAASKVLPADLLERLPAPSAAAA